MPEIVNFYESQQKNIIKTIIFMVLFVIFFVFLGFVISYYVGGGDFIVVSALIYSIVALFFSYFFSDKAVLKLSKAKEVSRSDYFDYYTVVENITLATGLPMPKLYVINDPVPNAFATGRDPKHSAIAATSGLLEKLDRSELEGVMAHEMSHVGNRDILLMSVVAVLVGTIAAIMDMLIRFRIYGSSDDNKNSGLISLVVLVFVAVLSPLIANIIKFAISRQREYLADATAVRYTRNPQGLINALTKISSDPREVKSASRATAHMYFENPLKENGITGKFASLFSTHPSITDRVSRLTSM